MLMPARQYMAQVLIREIIGYPIHAGTTGNGTFRNQATIGDLRALWKPFNPQALLVDVVQHQASRRRRIPCRLKLAGAVRESGLGTLI